MAREDDADDDDDDDDHDPDDGMQYGQTNNRCS